ncbi:MAG: hypothetical protein M3156_01970 [Thermoproteota archaeon]|nr:hypothetical protein [Thermoproteota archaeon]
MKTLLKSVRSISEEIDKAATLTTAEKHLLNLLRSEDKQLEDNEGLEEGPHYYTKGLPNIPQLH